MILPKLFSKSLTLWVTMFVSLAAFNIPVMAYNPSQPYHPPYVPQPVNYRTTIPVGYPTNPYLMPYGYNETAKEFPQVIMAGVSPSVIDKSDTSFDILALVRPGTKPLQKVSLGWNGGTSPLLNLTHVNTLKNGDQLWKYTLPFTAGYYGNAIVPVKWGRGANQYFIQATDAFTSPAFIQPHVNNFQDYNGSPFPEVSFNEAPRKAAFMDTTKNDYLNYNITKRSVTQVLMAGVSPAIVSIYDTSFDVVVLLRPDTLPIQNVVLKQGGNPSFSLTLEKRKQFTNGDEIWVATYPFRPGTYSVSTVPVVWGTGPGEYSIQVTDVAQQSVTAYPNLRAGDFPAQ
jgi:hypothetical protein